MAHLASSGTVSEESTEIWRDRKRYLWLLGLVIPSAVFAAYAVWDLTGWSWVLWLGPVLILVIIPILDLLTGLDPSNPPDEVIEALENDRYYRWVTYAFLPLQYAAFVLAAWFFGNPEMTTIDKIGFAASIGSMGGIAINTAHELGHKREEHERWFGKIALAQTFYGHFFIEHNRGHHVRVATPGDPASSRVGESLWRFLPRTVAGSLRSAWSLERKRIARRKQHPFRISNDVLNAWLMSAVLWGGLTVAFGVEILPFLVLQALVGVFLLETVNYLEHYGMLRQRTGPDGTGRYERVLPSHSWNSNNIATNVLLYHLQRHSDHHANPTRRYQCLRDYQESPVLPTGYAGMIVLAMFPPLWRRVMDKRVLAHFDGDMTRANILPRKRERILARYPRPESTAEEGGSRRDGGSDGGGRIADRQEVLAARCPGCGYTYDVAAGDEHEGFAAGTAWSEIPDTWCCPDCGVREKVDFVAVEKVDA
jgi:alkane 1-monooxygenase